MFFPLAGGHRPPAYSLSCRGFSGGDFSFGLIFFASRVRLPNCIELDALTKAARTPSYIYCLQPVREVERQVRDGFLKHRCRSGEWRAPLKIGPPQLPTRA